MLQNKSSMICSALILSLSACVTEEADDALLAEDISASQASTPPEASLSLASTSKLEEAPISTNGVGCNYTWSAPTNQCTGGVREWKGGCANNGFTYGGVGWSGDAHQWWANAPAAYRTQSPGLGYIVVFGPSAYNSYFGHVGVVMATSPQITFWSRHWKSNDYVGGMFEYLAACNCQLLGFLSYF